jgi:hypothetical protein
MILDAMKRRKERDQPEVRDQPTNQTNQLVPGSEDTQPTRVMAEERALRDI